jgi:DNA-binding HxlR family transcriptional regulator
VDDGLAADTAPPECIQNLDSPYAESIQKTNLAGTLDFVAASTAEPRACSIARTLDLVGEKWALLAVREVFLGNRRFDEMVKRTGAPRDTLAARLRTLVGAGILERRRYSDHPVRYEYWLTDAGQDLYPVIMTLMRWGDRYLAGDDGPPAVFEHRCGHRLVAELVCEACGEPLRARDAKRAAASW